MVPMNEFEQKAILSQKPDYDITQLSKTEVLVKEMQI